MFCRPEDVFNDEEVEESAEGEDQTPSKVLQCVLDQTAMNPLSFVIWIQKNVICKLVVYVICNYYSSRTELGVLRCFWVRPFVQVKKWNKRFLVAVQYFRFI
jgi:hypothetical protein